MSNGSATFEDETKRNEMVVRVGSLMSSSGLYLAVFMHKDGLTFNAGLHACDEGQAQFWSLHPNGRIEARAVGLFLKASDKTKDVILVDEEEDDDFSARWFYSDTTKHLILLSNGKSLMVQVAHESMPVKMAYTQPHELRQEWTFKEVMTPQPTTSPTLRPPPDIVASPRRPPSSPRARPCAD